MYSASFSGTELVLEGLAETCAQAGPSNCSLAQNRTTPAEIVQGVRDLINVCMRRTRGGFHTLILPRLHTMCTKQVTLISRRLIFEVCRDNLRRCNFSNHYS